VRQVTERTNQVLITTEVEVTAGNGNTLTLIKMALGEAETVRGAPSKYRADSFSVSWNLKITSSGLTFVKLNLPLSNGWVTWFIPNSVGRFFWSRPSINVATKLCSPGSTCKHDYWKFSTKKVGKLPG
jgi:hypothetical protein